MNKEKLSALSKSFLWGLCILLFPILSGVLSVLLSLETLETLLLQGTFMLISLLIPLAMVIKGKWKWSEIGFVPYDKVKGRKVFHFFPLLLVFVPVAIRGFYFKSFPYVLGNLYLYLAVGIAEEVYFRGIIPKYLKKAFSLRGIILISTVIFGTGHIASAFTTDSPLIIFLTVLNAYIFGWLAIEMVVISKSIIPAILFHFFFDFETKIVQISGDELLIAECVRGTLMVLAALCLALFIYKNKKTEPAN